MRKGKHLASIPGTPCRETRIGQATFPLEGIVGDKTDDGGCRELSEERNEKVREEYLGRGMWSI